MTILNFILTAIAGLGTVVLLYYIARRVIFRDALFIHDFDEPHPKTQFDGSIFASTLRNEFKKILSLHSETALRSAGEVTALQNPRRLSENLGDKISMFLVSQSQVAFLLDLFLKIFPRFAMEGEGFSRDGKIGCRSRIKKGSNVLDPPDPWHVEVDAADDEAILHLAKELACRAVIDTSRLRLIKDETNVGTANWMAFNAHTEALTEWQGDDFDIHNGEIVQSIDSKLEESLAHDPDYAIAHYNRGVLLYLTFKGFNSNDLARRHFLEAGRSAGAAGDRTIEGLAWVGVSRCYSQDCHRFGSIDMEAVTGARDAATKSMALLKGDERSKYAMAFAWHCTETLEDILEGRKHYNEIIKKAAGKYPVVHNNLGYILMVGGRLLQSAGKNGEAKEWWKEAKRQMDKTIKLDRPRSNLTKFALANLGNLHRMRREYGRAFESYQKALEIDPNYVEGYNELARLYFDVNDIAPGLKNHEEAMGLVESNDENRNRHLKLMSQLVEILGEKNHPAAAAVESLLDESKQFEGPVTVESWLSGLRPLLEDLP